MIRPQIVKRLSLIGLVLTVGFLLGGCAYLRLLQFKGQLKDFDRFVQVESGNGPTFVFRRPVLRSKDFTFLTGSQPTRKYSPSHDNTLSTWVWRFEKASPSPPGDPFAIAFETTFRDGLLERIEVDDTLLEAMESEFIRTMLASLGRAKIDKFKMAARAEINRDDAPRTPFPSLASIRRVLGNPTRVRAPETNSHQPTENEYVFNFRDPDSEDIAGQFKVIFKSARNRHTPISGFVLSGRGR